MGHIVVVMGVSGCGKTTLGRRLAQRLDCDFVDGDDLHPPANVEKMARGAPLGDADRAPWLDAVAAQLVQWRADGAGGVMACSALKRRYRDRLRRDGAGPTFVHLDADRAILETRLAARTGHFMPPSLLDSQLASLEPPAPDEDALTLDARGEPVGRPVEIVFDLVICHLLQGKSGRNPSSPVSREGRFEGTCHPQGSDTRLSPLQQHLANAC